MKNKNAPSRLGGKTPRAHKVVLGLMSGTSCDGLSVCAIRPAPFKFLAFKNYAYAPALQKRLLDAARLRAPQLSALNFELGKLYAQKTKLFLKYAGLRAEEILCAGVHGQTVYHGPMDKTPNTLQIAEPSFLAEALGCPVLSHFRERDMALGGQGAPLIPFFDEYIFGRGPAKILLNLGGVANISVAGKGVKTFGFDCGPANTLMDLACEKFLGLPFDKNGSRAAQGAPDAKLVRQLLKQKYFAKKPPKSLDKNDFGPAYLDKHFSALSKKRVNDLLATLNYFTAACAADALQRFVPARVQKQIIVSGGGARNQTLLKNLRRLTGLPVITSARAGIDPQAKEAAAFALMAWLALNGKPNHCARATGARKNTVLGQITL